MRIVIPVDESATEAPLSASFGRAPYFMLHDTEAGTTEFLENAAADAPSAAGIQSAQFAVDNGVGVLVTVHCGKNAAEVLRAAGVEIYKSFGQNAAENLTGFLEGKLAPMAQFDAGFHGIQ